MEIILPKNRQTKVQRQIDTQILVVLGANGSGKSFFGKDLCDRYENKSIRISGMHALFLGKIGRAHV